jgi:hypothetical protein
MLSPALDALRPCGALRCVERCCPSALQARRSEMSKGTLNVLDAGQPLHLVELHATILAAPAIVGDLRHADRADRCPVITSTCRSFAMISSGLCRFPIVILQLTQKAIPQLGPLRCRHLTGASWG